MVKKKKHTYKIGQTVKFKFFDGSVHEGKIVELNYMGDKGGDKIYYSCPQYTIHVPSNNYKRGYMVYGSMTDERIKEAYDHSYKTIDPRAPNWAKKELVNDAFSELDKAIERQKEFINKH